MADTRAQQLEKLKTARDQIMDLIVDITTNPKPSYSIDGETVQWSAYLSSLEARHEKICTRIAHMENTWNVTQGFT